MSRYQDITGQTFGRLTALSHAGSTPKGQAIWNWSCTCGGAKTAPAGEVRRGKVASCGCLAIEQKRAAAKSQQHPFSRANMYPERKSWENMIARCHTPTSKSYSNYGGRGISVCSRWRESFESFVQDMGKRPAGTTIERIDSNGGYSPDNCRWATMKEQANNRRTNHLITVGGQTRTIAQWADYLGISCYVIHTRIYQGMSDHDAVTKSMLKE